MATTYTFVVNSNTYVPGPTDPQVTITGTVDTIPPSSNGPTPVTVTLWKSAYDQANNQSLAALEALVAPLMLTQWKIANPPPPTPPVNQITGTFTYSL